MNSLKIYKFICAYFVFLIVTGNYTYAQDPNFSQFYNNPVYYNPGMAAINNGMTLRSNVRSLWTPVAGQFETYSVSFEAEAISNVGAALLAYSDVAGVGLLRTSGANMSYSYRAIDSKNIVFQLGLNGGIVNKYVDWSRYTFSDNFDEIFGNVYTSDFQRPGINNITYADFASGFALRFNNKARKSGSSYKYSTFTIGGAVHHLSKPKDAFFSETQRIPMKFVGHANANILIGNLIYSPAVIFERQNQFQTFSVGANIVNKPFHFGFWLRNRTYLFTGNTYDSFIFSIGSNLPANFGTALRFTYSFDMTLSRLRNASIGSHEISLMLDLENKKLFKRAQNKSKNKRKYKCPTDFKGYN